MNKVVHDPKFFVWFLKRKSRIKFLSMAVRHDFFKRNKDIRRYIAKWFFFDYVDILPRLVELGTSNSLYINNIDMTACVISKLTTKTNFGNVFDNVCHSYLFQRLYKSNLFWGIHLKNIQGFPKLSFICFNEFSTSFFVIGISSSDICLFFT